MSDANPEGNPPSIESLDLDDASVVVLRGDHWTPDHVKRVCEGLRGRYDWNGACLVLASNHDIGTMAAPEVLMLLQTALPRLSDEELAAVGLRRLPDFAAITRDVS